MYYEDLTHYRIGNKLYSIILNIGWIDINYPFPTGNVSVELINKLLELTLFNLDQHPMADKYGLHTHPKGIIVHTMHMMGSPFECPFCNKEIEIKDLNKRIMVLGKNEMCLPSYNSNITYNFPTLLYHYISEHHYLPPIEFLKSLDEFNLNQPYSCLDVC